MSGHRARVRDGVVEIAIAAASLAREVGVVDWWRYADGSRGPAEEKTHFVGQSLQVIRNCAPWADELFCKDLVEQDEVMGRACGALKGVVGLQKEVPVAGVGDSGVDNSRDSLQLAVS